jgi:hypothetical protein
MIVPLTGCLSPTLPHWTDHPGLLTLQAWLRATGRRTEPAIGR